MARRLCQFLLALAVLYALAVGAFAVFGYDGARPDVLTIAGEMHAWMGDRLRYKYEPPAGTAPREAPPPVRDPSPPPRTPAPAPRTDPRSRAYDRVSTELLPRALEQIKALEDRSAPDFENRRAAALATLTQARDLLGPYMDSGEADAEMRRLDKRVAELLTAVRHK